ncbi:CBS domain-containing protein [Sphingomonas sp. LY29]|uniref:CBS domain-containing protein n=1 Tax=unclassified Sphingomonas TaxID=196159 RepID=UPI002ADEA94E|nr:MULTISPECIES: CBS domain-containing protein [unclassified Sphingomonas]MEA1071603.1 CBS domain-containing protein [Sphingomonas sp. LY160]WRP25720.1 CBS domain-containing protein [Sphingomonas sp. LY29]
MNIRDLMTSDVKTVSPDATAQEAAGFMLSADTGSIPVCDGDKVIGMITDRDIAVRGVAEGKGPDCSVRDLMSSDLIYARDTDDVLAIAQRMSDKQVRRLPVLDAEDKLVGMVSLGDLSREAQESAAATALEGVSAAGGQHAQ